ncbi:hypothetical protein [Streptomyces sp. ALI-76-A]|jgi:hypothetical protein|uniref:hypothetical protein n=1 Tax=Streptomyces sp. ALI-76-A TaxID=3025736 RepID=UPI00256ED44C|nr:hypothetical protein [Streptomyces sp. ALI-76-A]MDL5201652.1 hypothetical protein [Streptomyces sp. ALI-76-A]
MKSLKAAAVLTGSLVIAGAAAPAFALSATEVAHESLNDAVTTLNQGPVKVAPLESSEVLDVKENKELALNAVNRSTAALSTGTPLVGGVPLES